MKSVFLCGVSLGALALGGSQAYAQQTAKQALAALTKSRGSAAASQVVQISGERGQDQPQTWRLMTRDPEFAGRFREYSVSKGRVLQVAPVPVEASSGLSPSPLVGGRIKVDSTMAFTRADDAAKKALIGFDSLNYELRNAEFSQSPVWVVRLLDQNAAVVGELAVSAESGKILRRSWYEAGRTPASAPPATAPRGTVSQPTASATGAAVSQKAQQVWDGTRQGLQQGTAAVKTGFTRAGDSLRDWFGKARGASTTPSSSTPPQTSGPSTWENGTYDSSRR